MSKSNIQNKHKLPRTITTLALLACTASLQAETLDGVLEKGALWSSLFTVSPESGDSIGQIFRNQSPIGKVILSHCLPDMPCQIDNAVKRNLDTVPAQNFATQASGWYEITAGQKSHMIAAIGDTQTTVNTLQGQLSIADDNTLRLRGKPVLPQVQGNNLLRIVMDYQIGKQNVILLANIGGSACPTQYQFVIIQPGSIKATPAFGSCSDIIYPRWDGQQTITIDMVGYAGPMNTDKERQQAAMTKVSYRYAQGRVMHNGKEIK